MWFETSEPDLKQVHKSKSDLCSQKSETLCNKQKSGYNPKIGVSILDTVCDLVPNFFLLNFLR